jgi:cytochrome d ubiquinol oxidase subunit II
MSVHTDLVVSVPIENLLVAAVILVSLVVYAVTGGADFGGGVWDLLARGPRASDQRDLIAHAIGPVWEANHVWLILVAVLVFVCFPLAFAAMGTALHIPLLAMLIGIVLRGSAFTFRAHGASDGGAHDSWGRVFAIASTVTPVALGVTVGALASGRLRVDAATGQVTTDYVSEWLAPFPIVLGLFTLAMFALTAAVYLTLETHDEALRDAFRRRALGAEVVTGVLAFGCLALAREGAPLIFAGLTMRRWSAVFQAITAASALGTIAALVARRFTLARIAVIAQASLVVLGWGFAQFPYLIEPDLTIVNAAPPAVMRAVLAALAVGGVVMLPSLVYLMRVFKRSRTAAS